MARRFAGVEGAGDQLLAGSARSLDEDRRVTRGDARQEREDLAHLTRAADQPIERALASELHLHALTLQLEPKRHLAKEHLIARLQKTIAQSYARDTEAVLRPKIGDSVSVQLKL